MKLLKIKEVLQQIRIEATEGYLDQCGKSVVVASDFKRIQDMAEKALAELKEFREGVISEKTLFDYIDEREYCIKTLGNRDLIRYISDYLELQKKPKQ